MVTTAIPTGKPDVDQNLLDALTRAGIRAQDAKELARMDAFGGTSIGAWIAGLRAVATIFIQGKVAFDWGTMPLPWATIGATLTANGTDPAIALPHAIDGYSCDLQSALIGAIAAMTDKLAQDATIPRHNNLGAAVTPNQAQAAQQLAQYLKPIDPMLIKQLQAILGKVKRGMATKQKKEAGERVVEWLAQHGKFIRTPLGARYYLYQVTRRLYALDTSAWEAFLYLLTGANPAGQDFRFFTADCKTAAEDGERLDVVKVAHWDTQQQILRVSRFDGQVYRLDGMSIELEANGDGPVLFEDSPAWAPYQPDFSGDGSTLEWSMVLPNWEVSPDHANQLYKSWWLATFFSELCPTRPILVLRGEKGSGKTMSLRVILKLLFGPTADVFGLPDKPDAFVTMASNCHIVVLDNMDTLAKDTRDKLASLSTGKLDQLRELYTTNESRTIRYRCWLTITSRTPDTLQRDDLVDRVVFLPVGRLRDDKRTRESLFLEEVMQKRNLWWGDILTALNSVVAELRKSGIPDRGGLRMEDWAALGRVISQTDGKEDTWEESLEKVRNQQSAFLLEENVVRSAVEAWLESSQYTPVPLLTRHLYEQSKAALFGVDRPDDTWPRSVKSFGRQLKGIQQELKAYLAQNGWEMNWRVLHGNFVYEFLRIL